MIVTTTCKTCGLPFDAERSDHVVMGRTFSFTRGICDGCEEEGVRRAKSANLREIAEQERAERASRNVPRRFEAASFTTFSASTPSQAEALAAVRDEALGGVYLMGRAGCGKTHLAAAAVLSGPIGSLFAPTTQLLDDIRAGYDGAGRNLYERALQAPLLALDDLGSESVTDWVRDRLYTLLNERWNACLPVVVTTNCTPKAIAERIGDGAASRLAGMCARRIEVKGVDMRRAERKVTP